jgi:hypothetical protein
MSPKRDEGGDISTCAFGMPNPTIIIQSGICRGLPRTVKEIIDFAAQCMYNGKAAGDDQAPTVPMAASGRKWLPMAADVKKYHDHKIYESSMLQWGTSAGKNSCGKNSVPNFGTVFFLPF